MVTVYIALACVTPTSRLHGEFDTYIALPETEFRRGAHIDIAKRRAGIVGYKGPYRLIQVRQVGAPLMPIDEIRAHLEELADPRRERWLSLIAQHEEKQIGQYAAPPATKSPRVVRRRERAPS